MSSIYQDAIADARKLKEVAEKNAKNRIIDVLTPKLRRLIEHELNEGDDEFVDDLEDIGGLVSGDDDLSMLDDLEDEEEMAEPELEPMASLPPPMDMDSDGFSQIELIDDIPEVEAEVEEDEESEEKSVHFNITVEAKNQLLRHRAKRLVKALSETKSSKERKKIIKELSILRKALIISEHKSNIRLAKNISVILKESNMRRRKNWLFEGEDDLDLDLGDEEGGDEDLDLEEEEPAGEEVSVDIGLLAQALGADEDALSDAMNGAAEEEEEDLDLDMEEEEEDLDLELETDEHGLKEGEKDDKDDEEIVEISESMLRRALRGTSRNKRSTSRRTQATRRSTRLAETRRKRAADVRRRRRNLREGEAKAMASHFGGGKLGKEMFVEVDENVLLNALAEELGSAHKASVGGDAKKAASSFGGGSVKSGVVPESRRRRNARNRRLSESRRRETQASPNRRAVIAERKAAAAQKELKESNLFNAKLLYVTKLMQQHTLNKKQQRAIVEAMDNAKTLREAKLLFSSLTESLNRRTSKKGSGNLNESNTRTGNSSKSLRSSAPANSGVELDRWAVLAGIKK